jgi:hypothetical protein
VDRDPGRNGSSVKVGQRALARWRCYNAKMPPRSRQMCKIMAIVLSLMSLGLTLGGCTGERLKSTSLGAQNLLFCSF